MLPKDPAFWILVVIGLFVLAGLAIWFGRGFEVGKWFIRVKQAEPKQVGTVSVGKNLEMSGGKVGGDISGDKRTGGPPSDISGRNIDVLSGGKLRNVDIGGDVTGSKHDEGSNSKK